MPATTALSDDADDASEDPAASASISAGSDERDEKTAAALAAIATAESATGGVAFAIDDQDDDGAWEVEVRDGNASIELAISADGKRVIDQERDDLDSEDRAALDAATITLTKAIQLALAEADGVLDDAELDVDDGRQTWQVTLDSGSGDDVEVVVSVTGDVLGADATGGSDDADDQNDDDADDRDDN